MTNLLYDLGTNSNEIAKNMPKIVPKVDAKKSDESKKDQKDSRSKSEEVKSILLWLFIKLPMFN